MIRKKLLFSDTPVNIPSPWRYLNATTFSLPANLRVEIFGSNLLCWLLVPSRLRFNCSLINVMFAAYQILLTLLDSCLCSFSLVNFSTPHRFDCSVIGVCWLIRRPSFVLLILSKSSFLHLFHFFDCQLLALHIPSTLRYHLSFAYI